MHIMILGIDLGKNSCSLVGLDESGMVVVRKRLRREGVIGFAAKLPPCVMRWKLAVVPIIWGGHWRRWGIRLDSCRRNMCGLT